MDRWRGGGFLDATAGQALAATWEAAGTAAMPGAKKRGARRYCGGACRNNMGVRSSAAGDRPLRRRGLGEERRDVVAVTVAAEGGEKAAGRVTP